MGSPILVLAGAGSGKTRVLTRRVAYLVANGVKPDNILAITFTNKAADEMKTRISQLLGMDVSNLWVGTFHSICARILRIEAERIGIDPRFTIFDESDQLSVIKRCVAESGLDPQIYDPEWLLNSISRAKDELVDPDSMAASARSHRGQNVAKLYAMYQQKLRANNALDFGDLIFCCVTLFARNQDVLQKYQQKFKHILVDEYQDTNHAQYVLVNMLASAHRQLMVVGDDDQSIYRFRGADPRNILEFERDYPDARVIRLEQNYRSTRNILAAASGVIEHNTARKGKKLWTENAKGGRVAVYQARDALDEARFVAKEIAYQAASQGLSLKDFAVLYRTHAQSRPFEQAFMEMGLAYQIIGGLRFYERKEIKDLLSFLRVLYNPLDLVSGFRALTCQKRGIGETTVEKLRNYAEAHGLNFLQLLEQKEKVPALGKAALNRLQAFREKLDWISRRMEEGARAALEAVLEATGYLAELEASDDLQSQARAENVNELLSVAAEMDRGGDGVKKLLENASLLTGIDYFQPDKDAVVMMTLHSAKGLEFPVVFMVGMEEGLFPHVRCMGNGDDIEEERRLCYVGMTRAMKSLYLTYAAERLGSHGIPKVCIPSRFLSEIPRHTVVYL